MKTAPRSCLTALLTMAPSAFGEGAAAGALPRIKSLAALRKEVLAWAAETRQRLSGRDVEALVSWLNRNFYKL